MRTTKFVVIAAAQGYPFGPDQLQWATEVLTRMHATTLISVTHDGVEDLALYLSRQLGLAYMKIPPQPEQPDEGYYHNANHPTQEQLIGKTATAVVTFGEGEIVQEMKRIAGNQWLLLEEFRNALLDVFDAGFDI